MAYRLQQSWWKETQMNISSIVAEALRATESHKLHLRRSCQHIAIRYASEHPTGMFSTDQLRKVYETFGKSKKDSRWRSSIMPELAKAGIFSQVGYSKSNHPGRGSRPMMVWKLTRNIRIILRWLDEHPVQPSEVASQSTLFEI